MHPRMAPSKHPIRRYCLERNISQRDFAAVVGLTEGFISQLVHGHEVCGRSAAIEIVKKTGGEIRLEELITWEANKKT